MHAELRAVPSDWPSVNKANNSSAEPASVVLKRKKCIINIACAHFEVSEHLNGEALI